MSLKLHNLTVFFQPRGHIDDNVTGDGVTSNIPKLQS